MISESSAEAPALRWDTALLWFMRLTGVGWLIKGLVYWAVLFDIMPEAPAFETQTLQWQSAIVYFAIIDLVAAVGLWLTSAWGGVIWLLAALSYLLMGFFVPHAVVSGLFVPAATVLLIISYFVLSWHTSRIVS